MGTIGIDLGTSNSAAAVLRGGRPIIIPSAEGISLGGKAQMATNPGGTATAFKRRMGRREQIRLRDREFSPEQLSAFLLQKIKRDAEAFLGEPTVGEPTGEVRPSGSGPRGRGVDAEYRETKSA